MSDAKMAIEIKNLVKTFGVKRAVDNISLEIPEGCLFSLLGVNGAGKTTTIRMLMGLSKPDSGEIRILGKNPEKEPEETKKIANFSPQETSVAPNLTVRENLEFIAEIYGMGRKKAVERADEMIAFFSMEEVEGKKAKLLSGGWQRKLSIAMALITAPKVLFLDEPTLGLDVLARKELWKVIEDLKGKVTVILTTHYMEEAEKLSDKLAVMINGKIKAEGSVQDLLKKTGQSSLEDAFIAIAEEGK